MRYNRKELLEYIDIVSFAAMDAAMFLDTHPDDEAAIEYFNNYQQARNQALKEYTGAFGALNLNNATFHNKFTWATEDWPWQ